jgi:5-methylcytosine-specific restriction endonuclease McrA
MRQEEHRRECEKAGKTYRTWDEIQAGKTEKRQLLDLKKDALKAWENWVLALAPNQWLDAFYRATGKPWTDHRLSVAERYKTRYSADDSFHKKEKTRSQAFKHDHPEHASQWANGNQRVMQQHDGTMRKGVAVQLLNELRTCPYCSCDLTMDNRELDHMDPLSLGGMHGVSNLIVCCATCNREKQATPFFQWLRNMHPSNQSRALTIYQQKKQISEAA